ncbi:PAS domain-containing protein [Nisaea acidiphila]|uniref:PAS domain-containing protein n=1 Tax=Nisaea acidiphila TaxID=1862145 RepID=A0A9J7AN66_9PROT|nr:PAS domain-containing protein [Nisaea acidiphila]UUX48606.1 PAS domain-containing protein [Nisaea acidiphila]
MREITETEFGNGTLGRAFDYWNGIRGQSAWPMRRDLDPMDIGPALLPHSMLVDVDPVARNVRHRVVGTSFSDHFGRELTGTTLTEILSGSYLDFITELFMTSFERGAPIFSESRFRWDEGRLLRTWRLMMPLSRDGKSPDMSFVVQVFDQTPPPPLPKVKLFERGAWNDISERFSVFAVDAAVL